MLIIAAVGEEKKFSSTLLETLAGSKNQTDKDRLIRIAHKFYEIFTCTWETSQENEDPKE